MGGPSPLPPAWRTFRPVLSQPCLSSCPEGGGGRAWRSRGPDRGKREWEEERGWGRRHPRQLDSVTLSPGAGLLLPERGPAGGGRGTPSSQLGACSRDDEMGSVLGASCSGSGSQLPTPLPSHKLHTRPSPVTSKGCLEEEDDSMEAKGLEHRGWQPAGALEGLKLGFSPCPGQGWRAAAEDPRGTRVSRTGAAHLLGPSPCPCVPRKRDQVATA